MPATSFHLDSIDELEGDILKEIKALFKGQSVTVTVDFNNEVAVPLWQQQLVKERQEVYKNNPERLLDWDTAKKKIKTD